MNSVKLTVHLMEILDGKGGLDPSMAPTELRHWVGALQPDLQPRKSEVFFYKKNCGQRWNHKLQVKSQQMAVF